MADQQFTTDELQSEEWRDVVNYEGFYQVSTLGRVRRTVTRYGNPIQPHIMRPSAGRYMTLCLSRGGKVEGRTVHSLVAHAFLGFPLVVGHEINHKDGVKHNNRLTNLEYATKSENAIHSCLLLHPKKLTPDDVHEIRRRLASGEKGAAIGRAFGVTQMTINDIKHGHSWSHLH